MSKRLRGNLILLFVTFMIISGCERVSMTFLPTPVPATRTTVPTVTTTPTPRMTPTPIDPIGVKESELKGIEIEIWHGWGSPQKELLEAQIAEFNRKNTWDITVSARAFQDLISLYETVNQNVDSQDMPELVVALPEYALDWNDQGAVIDLTDYVTHPTWGLSDDDIADIPPVIWDQDQVGEKRLGLPAERSTRLLFYNARWGRELGFESAPKTALEFRAQSCAANDQFRSDTLLSNDGFGGWIVDSDPQSALSWLLSFGGGAVDGNTYNFTTDENTLAFTFLKSLFDDGCAWIYTGLDPYAPLADRTALVVPGDLTELSEQANAFSTAENGDEWQVIPYPGADDLVNLVYGPSYIVMKDSSKKQLAAWLFARWMLRPEIQTQWTKATGMLPIRESSMKSLKSYADSHPQWAQAVALLDQAEIHPPLASWRTVKYVLGDGLYSIFRLNLPVSDIPSVLQEMQATAEDMNR